MRQASRVDPLNAIVRRDAEDSWLQAVIENLDQQRLGTDLRPCGLTVTEHRGRTDESGNEDEGQGGSPTKHTSGRVAPAGHHYSMVPPVL